MSENSNPTGESKSKIGLHRGCMVGQSVSYTHCSICRVLCTSTSLICLSCKQKSFDKLSAEDIQNLSSNPACASPCLPDSSWRRHYPLPGRSQETLAKVFISGQLMDVRFYKEYGNTHTLYICDFCLQHFHCSFSYSRHTTRCAFSPEIQNYGRLRYNDGKISVYEVDGKKEQQFCRNLCILGKFFLDHKTLSYDVDGFRFYTCYSENQFVGFFSKENLTSNNLSCIIVLPVHQGKGYGHFLIDLSYKISILRNEVGTPEKPLSPLGLKAYQKYWRQTVYFYLTGLSCQEISIENISENTGMTVDDVVYGLEMLKFLKFHQGEYFISIEKRPISKMPLVDSKFLYK